MGLLSGRNVDVVGEDARQAAESGSSVFMTVLHSSSVGAMSGDLQVRTEWAKRVAAIEAEGWSLDQWAVSRDSKGNPEGYPVFRRVQRDR